MIIALPSNDGEKISTHFGRSRSFIIYEISDGSAMKKELRKNNGVHDEGAGCHNHEQGTGHHSHDTVLEVLKGVDLVIAGGMGKKIYEDLLCAGIVAITTDEASCDTAVQSFMAGTLKGSQGKMCGCNH